MRSGRWLMGAEGIWCHECYRKMAPQVLPKYGNICVVGRWGHWCCRKMTSLVLWKDGSSTGFLVTRADAVVIWEQGIPAIGLSLLPIPGLSAQCQELAERPEEKEEPRSMALRGAYTIPWKSTSHFSEWEAELVLWEGLARLYFAWFWTVTTGRLHLWKKKKEEKNIFHKVPILDSKNSPEKKEKT